MWSLPDCGWATGHRGRLPERWGSPIAQPVISATLPLPIPPSITAWPAPLCIISYPRDCRWTLFVAIFLVTTSWLNCWSASLVSGDLLNLLHREIILVYLCFFYFRVSPSVAFVIVCVPHFSQLWLNTPVFSCLYNFVNVWHCMCNKFTKSSTNQHSSAARW